MSHPTDPNSPLSHRYFPIFDPSPLYKLMRTLGQGIFEIISYIHIYKIIPSDLNDVMQPQILACLDQASTKFNKSILQITNLLALIRLSDLRYMMHVTSL